ncbi:SGNH/GDSL hydrolase family protein [Microlunatus antarcticus]
MVAALAALVVGLTAGVPGPGTDVAWAAPTPTAVAPKPPALLDLPAQPRVLIVGDSYTEGWGADPETEGFAFKVAAPLGWRLTRDGIGATGYRKPGAHQEGTYAQRLWRHPADAYDLVVLQGGSNDEKYAEADISAAVELTLRTVRQRYPSARLVVMEPIALYGSVYPNRAKLMRVLATSTSQHSLLVIDPVAEEWFVKGGDPALVNHAKGHPSNAGYARIADLFVRDVRALSVVRPAR